MKTLPLMLIVLLGQFAPFDIGCGKKKESATPKSEIDERMSDACTSKLVHDCGMHDGRKCVDAKQCTVCCASKGADHSDATRGSCTCFRSVSGGK